MAVRKSSGGGTHSDAVSRAVVTIEASGVGKNWEFAKHQHRKAQLLLTVRGVIRCEIEEGLWIVPPQCALWIPGGLPHRVQGLGETECYCLFVEPDACPDLPREGCTLSVSLLLRELVLRAAALPTLYEVQGSEGRLIATLLDELVAAPIERFHLPMPRGERLRRLAEMLLSDPAGKSSLASWGRRIGVSERGLSRLLAKDVGMSFGQWRRQLHVVLALQRLTKGDSVQTIALDLGYENASSFVTMFRKAVGKPPARYASQRRDTGGSSDERTPPRGIVLPKDA